MTNTAQWLEAIDNHPNLGTDAYTAALAHAAGTTTDLDNRADATAHLMLTSAGFLRPISIDGPAWSYEITLPVPFPFPFQPQPQRHADGPSPITEGEER